MLHADILPVAKDVIPDGCKVFVVPTPPEIAQAYHVDPALCAVPAGWTDWNEWVEAQEPRTTPPTTTRASMIYTSGTTGHPKGVKRQPADAAAQARSAELYKIVFGLTPDPSIRAVITGPMYHSAPNAYGRGYG